MTVRIMVSPWSDLSHVRTDPAAPAWRRRGYVPRVALRRSLLRQPRSGAIPGSLDRRPGRVMGTRPRRQHGQAGHLRPQSRVGAVLRTAHGLSEAVDPLRLGAELTGLPGGEQG